MIENTRLNFADCGSLTDRTSTELIVICPDPHLPIEIEIMELKYDI